MNSSNKIKIIALFGKAGSGKDTIQKSVLAQFENLVNEIISCTTRPPRDYEKDGIDYHFLSIEDFTKKVLDGSMLEATEFRGWFYGTPFDSLDPNKINIGVFNIAGIQALLEDSRLEVYPVQVYAPDKICLMRQLLREENPDCEEICRRFKTDNNDFFEIDFSSFFVWENYDVKETLSEHLIDVSNTFARLLEKISLCANDD